MSKNIELKPIAENADYAALQKKSSAINAEMAHIDKEIQRLQGVRFSASLENPACATVSGADELAAGLALLAGTGVAPVDLDATLTSLFARREILRPAQREIARQIDSVRDRLAADAAFAVKPKHAEAMQDVLAAAKALARAHDKERAVRSEIAEAGYTIRDDILPSPLVGGCIALCVPGSAGVLHALTMQVEGLGR